MSKAFDTQLRNLIRQYQMDKSEDSAIKIANLVSRLPLDSNIDDFVGVQVVLKPEVFRDAISWFESWADAISSHNALPSYWLEIPGLDDDLFENDDSVPPVIAFYIKTYKEQGYNYIHFTREWML